MKKLFIAMINFYRKHISPMKAPCCRFYPTCSEYALQAFSMHGALRGLILTAARILRCNPLFRSGEDYVPVKFLWHIAE